MALFEVIEKQGLKMIKASVDNDTVRAEAVRDNRLSLIKAFADLTAGIIDLTQIQGS